MKASAAILLLSVLAIMILLPTTFAVNHPSSPSLIADGGDPPPPFPRQPSLIADGDPVPPFPRQPAGFELV